MPIMGSRVISMLSSPSRGSSGGVSSLSLAVRDDLAAMSRGWPLMMTNAHRCTHPSRLIRPGIDAPVYRDVRVRVDAFLGTDPTGCVRCQHAGGWRFSAGPGRNEVRQVLCRVLQRIWWRSAVELREESH